MLTDPTSGVGYAYGEVLPSADVNTVFTQQPDAIDGGGGGTWNPSATINIGGSGFGTVANLTTLTACTTATIATVNVSTLINADGLIRCAGASISFDADNGNDASLIRTQQTGTGAGTSARLRILGQDGQAQTGATANNDGGPVILRGGAAGTGGSGDEAAPGAVYMPPNSASGSSDVEGFYQWVFCNTVSASGNTDFLIPAVLGTNRTGAGVITVSARNAAGHEYIGRRSFFARSSGAGAVTVTNGAVEWEQTNGFSNDPGMGVNTTSVPAGKFNVNITEGDGADIEVCVRVELYVTEDI